MDKDVLLDLYYKTSILREVEKLITKSFLEKNIPNLPNSYNNLESLAVCLVSVTEKDDYFCSLDRAHPYYILRHKNIERGIVNYFKILKTTKSIVDNNLKTFYFEELPNRIFNIIGGLATSFKETSIPPSFIITLDSKRASSSDFLESILFSISHGLSSIYVIEKTDKEHDLSKLNKILNSHKEKIYELETNTYDIFSLRSTFQKAIRSAKEYNMPSIVICDATDHNQDCIKYLENKLTSLSIPLNEIKEKLLEDVQYLIKENLFKSQNQAAGN